MPSPESRQQTDIESGVPAFTLGSIARSNARLLAWFVAWTIFFGLNIQRLYDLVVGLDIEVFGSDGQDTAAMLSSLSLDTPDAYKHPLFALGGRFLVFVLQSVTDLSDHSAIVLALALMGAACMLMALLVFRSLTGNSLSTWIGGLLYGLSFSNLVIFSIPETYCVSLFILLCYMNVFLFLKDRLTTGGALVLGMLAGAAGLANVPLLTLGLIPGIYMTMTRNWRDTFWFSSVMLVTSVVVYLGVVLVVFGPEQILFAQNYSNDWLMWSQLARLPVYLSVWLQFFLYSLVAPGVEIQVHYFTADSLLYFHSPAALVALAGLVAGFLVSLRIAISTRSALVCSLLVWMFALSIFYVVFNAAESILYSVQVLPAVCMLLVIAHKHVAVRSWTMTATLLTIGCLAFNNLNIFYAALPAG